MQHHPIIRIKKFLSIIITLKLIVFQHKTNFRIFLFQVELCWDEEHEVCPVLPAGTKWVRAGAAALRGDDTLAGGTGHSSWLVFSVLVLSSLCCCDAISAACAGWDVGWVHVLPRAARAARQQGEVLQGQQGGGLAIRDTQGGDGAGQQLQVDRPPQTHCRIVAPLVSVRFGLFLCFTVWVCL